VTTKKTRHVCFFAPKFGSKFYPGARVKDKLLICLAASARVLTQWRHLSGTGNALSAMFLASFRMTFYSYFHNYVGTCIYIKHSRPSTGANVSG